MNYKLGRLTKILLVLLGLSLVAWIGLILVMTPDLDFPSRYGIKKSQAIALIVLPVTALLLLLPLLYVRSSRYKGPWSKHQREPMLVEQGPDTIPLVQQGKKVIVELDRRGRVVIPENEDEDEKGGKDGRSRSKS